VTPADVATVNEALAIIWHLAQARGHDVDIAIRNDGRVCFYFRDTTGWSDTARGELVAGGAHPLPGEALAALAVTP